MKASQVLRKALNENYIQSQGTLSENQSPFMCHSIEYALTGGIVVTGHENSDLVIDVINTFMPTIMIGGKSTLMDLLKAEDDEYYQAYIKSGSHYSSECFALRIKWWNNYIDELEAKGL